MTEPRINPGPPDIRKDEIITADWLNKTRNRPSGPGEATVVPRHRFIPPASGFWARVTAVDSDAVGTLISIVKVIQYATPNSQESGWVDDPNWTECDARPVNYSDAAPAVGRRVWVRARMVGGNEIEYTIEVAAAEFDARITGYAVVTADKQWTYSFEQVAKTAIGYRTATTAKWTAIDGGVTGTNTAYNRAEDMNAATAVGQPYGNGTKRETTPTFTLQPAPTGLIVRMLTVSTDDDTTEYWFTSENGVECV